MHNYRKVLALVTAIIMVIVVGCSSGNTGKTNTPPESSNKPSNNEAAPPAPENTDPIKIQYWHSHAEAQMPALEYMLEEFNKKYPHITVEPVYQGVYADLHKKLQAAVAAKDVPAVSNVEVASLPNFADSGVFSDLTGYIQRDGVDTSDFSQGMLQAYGFNGGQYGLPLIVSSSVFVYNKTLLDSLNVQPPQTWDEIPAFIDAVHLKENGATKRYAFSIPGWDTWYYDPWIVNGGGSIINEDHSAATVGSGESMRAWNMFKEWMDKDAVQFGFGQGASGTMRQMFYDQEIAMVYHSSALIKGYVETAEFEVGVSFIPGDVKRQSNIGGAGIVLMDGAPDAEKEAGWKFIEFMTSAEHNIAWADKVGYLPTRKSAVDSEAGKEYLATWPQYGAVLENFDNVLPRIQHPGYGEFSDIYKEVMGEMILNGANPADLLPNAEEQMNEVLADYS